MSDNKNVIYVPSNNFWQELYPDGMTAADIEKELDDFAVACTEVPQVYAYVTGSRISKVTTSANEVINIAFEREDAWVKQELADKKDEIVDVLYGHITLRDIYSLEGCERLQLMDGLDRIMRSLITKVKALL